MIWNLSKIILSSLADMYLPITQEVVAMATRCALLNLKTDRVTVLMGRRLGT